MQKNEIFNSQIAPSESNRSRVYNAFPFMLSFPLYCNNFLIKKKPRFYSTRIWYFAIANGNLSWQMVCGLNWTKNKNLTLDKPFEKSELS